MEGNAYVCGFHIQDTDEREGIDAIRDAFRQADGQNYAAVLVYGGRHLICM